MKKDPLAVILGLYYEPLALKQSGELIRCDHRGEHRPEGAVQKHLVASSPASSRCSCCCFGERRGIEALLADVLKVVGAVEEVERARVKGTQNRPMRQVHPHLLHDQADEPLVLQGAHCAEQLKKDGLLRLRRACSGEGVKRVVNIQYGHASEAAMVMRLLRMSSVAAAASH